MGSFSLNGAKAADGYAMLAALLITALSATFALAITGAVHSLQMVERADASSRRASIALGDAVDHLARTLRWRPAAADGSAHEEYEGRSWSAIWESCPSVDETAWTRVGVQAEGRVSTALCRDRLTVELRREPWAMGITCAEDAEIASTLAVDGCGVYVGGCLRGRENIRFGDDALPGGTLPESPVLDLVHGDVFATAAVHAGAAIFARGQEIHQADEAARFPDDTDSHAGQLVPSSWLGGPSAELQLAALTEAHVVDTDSSRGILSLSDTPAAAGDEVAQGRLLLALSSGEVAIQGSPVPQTGRLLIVVPGDAILGQAGETVVLDGGIVVGGRLEVRGRLVLRGSLHAGSLSVQAPTCISVDEDWRRESLPGVVVPTIVERG